MTASQSQIILRPGTIEDAPAMLLLMDIAMEWLVDQGRTDQWGTKKSADNPDRVKQMAELAGSGGAWVAIYTGARDAAAKSDQQPAEGDEEARRRKILGGVVGALVVGQANSYVPPATEPELYIKYLITHRASAGRGLGKTLLDQARTLARDAGISLLRVDCFGGNDGKLVKYYESQGFQRTEAFEQQGWSGQILIQRLA